MTPTEEHLIYVSPAKCVAHLTPLPCPLCVVESEKRDHDPRFPHGSGGVLLWAVDTCIECLSYPEAIRHRVYSELHKAAPGAYDREVVLGPVFRRLPFDVQVAVRVAYAVEVSGNPELWTRYQADLVRGVTL